MNRFIMQKLINKYFNKLCSDKFFQYDDEIIIGKVKDVIQDLKEQIEYVKEPKNNFDKEEIKFITNEAKKLINEIQNTYSNKNDIIELVVHPMLGFYSLGDRKNLYEELKMYYDELEEK